MSTIDSRMSDHLKKCGEQYTKASLDAESSEFVTSNMVIAHTYMATALLAARMEVLYARLHDIETVLGGIHRVTVQEVEGE